MSEDFDREAEKERLRKKLEDDQETRKATEHMSDLLLKGATMTNHHCDACGDPIFRYDGQEFCPTCGEQVGEDGAERANPDDEGETDADTANGGDRPGDGRDDDDENRRDDGAVVAARDAAGETADTEGTTDDAGTTDTGPSPARHRDATPGQPAGAAASRGSPRGESTERDSGPAQEASPPARGGDIEEVRATLVRTLSSLTARAEAAEDPGRARDLLGAAHEAAETLAAVDGVNR
jgi:uncharacterized Zn finger protein (UPF0148 family)